MGQKLADAEREVEKQKMLVEQEKAKASKMTAKQLKGAVATRKQQSEKESEAASREAQIMGEMAKKLEEERAEWRGSFLVLVKPKRSHRSCGRR